MKKAAFILALLVIPIIGIIIAIFASGGSSVPPPKAVTLTIWGTKPEAHFNKVFSAYTASRGYVTIKYSQVSPVNYRDNLIEAWALGTGPDVFMFPADELMSYKDFMTPAPATTTNYVYTKTKQFGIKEEISITKSEIAGPTIASMKRDFVDTAAVDLIADGKVYALPLYMETLVLYSNRDLLNQARIALPASTWDQFVQQVPKITVINSEGTLIQAGASIGTAENVTHAADILSLIIMQNGGSIVNTATGTATLGVGNKEVTEQAILFYTDFGRESKSVYSWNNTQEQSLNAFAAGKVGYYLGYPSDEQTIIERSTNLNYDITDMLQINTQQPLNLAHYEAFGVSATSESANTSWNFIQYLTSNQGATRYSAVSLDTPARKDLIDVLLNSTPDPKFEVYAGQALSAQSWYRGSRKEEAELALGKMVTATLESSSSISSLVSDALEQLKVLQQ